MISLQLYVYMLTYDSTVFTDSYLQSSLSGDYHGQNTELSRTPEKGCREN